MPNRGKKYYYDKSERNSIETALYSAGCDADAANQLIESIEDLITIYLNHSDEINKLPKPKERQGIIESALIGTINEPLWLRDMTDHGDKREILKLLSESILKRGPQKNISFEFLIGTLGFYYETYTGQRPTVTWDEHKNRYSGKFFELVNNCLKPLGPDHSKKNHALGKAIKRILK